MNKQKGYLLILALVLIIVVTFIGTVLVRLFISETKTTTNDYLSKVALYKAVSCLEHVKRKIAVYDMGCAQFTADSIYQSCGFNSDVSGTPASESQVTGTYNTAISQLTYFINQQSTVVSLRSTADFAESGLVVIGSDMFSYSGISGNSLLNVRWVWGSHQVTHEGTHEVGEQVAQAQCTINVTTGIPSLTNPEAKRIIKQSILGGVGFDSQGAVPAIVSGQKVDLGGSVSVLNNCFMLSDNDYSTCATIVAADNVKLSGSAHTEIISNFGGTVVSSDKNWLKDDVIENYEPIQSGALYDYIFKIPFNELAGKANTYIAHTIDDSNISELNQAVGPIVWVKGSIDLNTSNATVGNFSSPVILVVTGDINMNGNAGLSITGITYVGGNVNTRGNANLKNYGQLVVEKNIVARGGGTYYINYMALSILGGIVSPYIRTIQSARITNALQEVFP